jgi:hypothetical protein
MLARAIDLETELACTVDVAPSRSLQVESPPKLRAPPSPYEE